MSARVKVINLEEDRPTVRQGLLRLDHALFVAREERIRLLKLIHGYGSSGVGGALRIEVWKTLTEFKRRGTVREFIPGEQFRLSDDCTWAVLKRFPQLKHDSDLGRSNKGITIVVL